VTPRPPTWARRLLARIVPDDGLGRTVLADLEEEFLIRCERGRGGARFWYVREALGLAAHFGMRRLGRGLGATFAPGRRGLDLGRAARRLRRAPGFAAVAVLTMALGIGASVAVFSVVKTVLLDPLPYEEPQELVALFEWNTVRDVRKNVANPGNVRVWEERSRALANVSAVSLVQPEAVLVAGEVSEALVVYSSPDFFQLLGVEAAVGRTFSAFSETSEGWEAVLSHTYWRERFYGDPGVVGRTLDVDGTPVTVVGVLPDEYVVHGQGGDLWVRLDLTRGDQTNSGRWLYPVGRLAEGATVDQARVELETIAAALRDEYPEFNAGWSVTVLPLQTEVVGDVQAALWLLLGAVGLLLAIACANVAGLFLVRGARRGREMAVRASLGASREDLVGQLLVESLVVSGTGTALGVLLGHLGTRLFAGGVPDAFALPRVEAAGVDPGVLAVAAGLVFLTGMAFGLVPALRAAGTDAAEALHAGGRGSSAGGGWVGSGLVVMEVALSVVLLSGAVLLGKSFSELTAVDPGIDPASVVVGRVNPTGEAYEEDADRVAFFETLVTELEARPGVEAVGGITFLPIEGWGAGTSIWPGDRPPPADEDRRAADVRNVTDGYFQAMGLTLLQGRPFDRRDVPQAPRAVVVNRTLAERHWPGESALGKPLVINWDDRTPWEIVGIVEDVRMGGLDTDPREAVYLHYPQAPFFGWLHVAVRGTRDAAELAGELRGGVAALDPGVPVSSVEPMEQVVSRSLAGPRVTTVLMGVFAALATTLAAVGLYGVLAYAVSRRVREIGIRVAMGATTGGILRLVVGRGALLIGLGVAVGWGTAFAGGRVLSGLLFQVDPADPLSLGAAGVGVVAVALLACLLPALRATRVPPLEALRRE